MAGDVTGFSQIGKLDWHTSDDIEVIDGMISVKLVNDFELSVDNRNLFEHFDSIQSIKEAPLFATLLSMDVMCEDDVLNFVKQFGFLWKDMGSIIGSETGGFALYTEPVDKIQLALYHVKQLIELYRRTKDCQIEPHSLYQFVVDDLVIDLFQNATSQKRYHFICEVEDRLEDLAHQCLWMLSEEISVRIEPVHLVSDLNDSAMELYEVWKPDCLLTAIFYMLHLHITNHHLVRYCKNCGTPFFVNHRNKKRVYCNERCRNVYTTRKSRAKKKEREMLGL